MLRSTRLIRRAIPALLSLVLCAAIFAIAGCGGVSRLPITGTVTIDEKPLAKGYICFRPLSATSSPTAGAEIHDGKFSINRNGGVLPGQFRVEITAVRAVGRGGIDPETGKKSDDLEQYLPAKYNSRSELKAEVSDKKANEFQFDLKSKGK